MNQLRDIQDLILVRAAQRGQTKAFDSIVARYQRRIYNLALRMCPTEADAEDATQEAFVAVYRGIKGFKGGASLDTWIHRVAVNACLMRRRKAAGGSDATVDDTVLDERLPDTAPDPLAEALQTELSATVADAVKRLPEAQQTVVLLHGMQGFTYAEIATILACPIGTVKSRLSAAFTCMRRTLAEYVQPEPSITAAPTPATEASR
ncbi:MAG TPA: sigma-70 family RNA polymerase sigma factor [Capsulimonadaceae bacterium]|jgi:RNA polymerase sigma-70 factor (ECF subfamily)